MSRPDTEQVQTRDGPMWVLTHDAYVSRALKIYGEYCQSEANLFRTLVRKGDIVVEAGANLGAHTIGLARACAPGRLFAFEPQLRVFQLLCANLVANQIANVVTLQEAVGAQPGVVRLPPLDYGRLSNFGGVSLDLGGPEAGGDPVRVTPIDQLCLDACGFLKIDVEGWELQAVEGAASTIARCRPILYLENDRAAHQGALIEAVTALGYAAFWHVAPIFDPANLRGIEADVFDGASSLNMVCTPLERPIHLPLARIDPANWRSPLPLSQ